MTIQDLVYFNKKHIVKSATILAAGWCFILFFIFHGIRGFLRWIPAVIEYQETTALAFSLAFFCALGVYVLLKRIHNKTIAIVFLDEKLASFYRNADPITGDVRGEPREDYDMLYCDDVKKEILSARCYIRERTNK